MLKQVKRFSSFLKNSTNYWKETFSDLNENLCQNADNEQAFGSNRIKNNKEIDNVNLQGKKTNLESNYIDKNFSDERVIVNENSRNDCTGKIESNYSLYFVFKNNSNSKFLYSIN